MIIIIQRHVCLDHAWHEWGTWLSSHNGCPRSIMKEFHILHTFLHLLRKDWADLQKQLCKNSFYRFQIGTISFAFELTWTMDLWHGRLGVRFLRMSTPSFLPFGPIHLADYLHWKNTTFSLNQYREIFDFLTELHRIESWENIPLEFHWLAVNSVQVSVFLRCFEPLQSLFPYNVWLGVLVYLTQKIQNMEIRRPSCAEDWWLVHHQRQILPWKIFWINCFHSTDLMLLGDKFRR